MAALAAESPDTLLRHTAEHTHKHIPKEGLVHSDKLFPESPPTFSASKLLFISAPSMRVCLSDVDVSAPLSFPARSMRENLP